MSTGPSDYDAAFLAEVGRLLPDADVVAQRLQRPAARPTDSRVARADAEEAHALAADTLIELWRRLLADVPAPDELRVRWVTVTAPDRVSAEAAARCPGAASAAAAVIDRVEARLDQDGWSWTRRDPDAAGALRIVGRQRQCGFDLGIRPSDDVVVLRTRTVEVLVGDLATDLLRRPATVRPWPAAPTRASPT